MLSITSKGDLKTVENYLRKNLGRSYMAVLHKYGQEGVQALSNATPLETGKTSISWNYEISEDSKGISIIWNNTNVNDGVNIAVILQYGHGTGTGGYVEGIDYINPALRPIFENIADAIWKEVTSV